MIHQLDDILRPAGAAGRGLVALPVIAVVDRHDAMTLRDLRRDAGVEPHALRVVRIAVHEHDPRSAVAVRQVMNLDAVAGGEEAVLLPDHHRRRGWTRRGSLFGGRRRREGQQDDEREADSHGRRVCHSGRVFDSHLSISGQIGAPDKLWPKPGKTTCA